MNILNWLRRTKVKVCPECEGTGKMGHEDCYPSKNSVKKYLNGYSYFVDYIICPVCKGTGEKNE